MGGDLGVHEEPDEDDDDVEDEVANQLKDIGNELQNNKLNEMDPATIGTNELSEAQKEQQLMGAAGNLGLMHQDTPRKLIISPEISKDDEEKKESKTGNYGLPITDENAETEPNESTECTEAADAENDDDDDKETESDSVADGLSENKGNGSTESESARIDKVDGDEVEADSEELATSEPMPIDNE